MNERALKLSADDESAQPPADIRPPSRARNALLKRLADVVCLPSSRVNSFERAMTADLLVDLLREASIEERERVARRVSSLSEVPATLARLLLRDEINVSAHMLQECVALTDSDLLHCVRHATVEHRRMVAKRRGLTEMVSESLADHGEPIVIEALLKNEQATISPAGIEMITAASRENPRLIPLLLKRPELRPSHAFAMFWWAEFEARRYILQRFATSREVLQDASSDVFAMAAEEKWQDPLSRKALQFIERRQRNRAAIEKSRFDSLEHAIAVAEAGITREMAEEISYVAGLKPITGAKIFMDPGGEALAMLCKATGLKRKHLVQLWRGLRRPDTDSSGEMTLRLRQAIEVYDTIAVDRAQTALRYWNWSLSSAMTPALVKAIREGDEQALDEYSVPQRVAMLALARDFSR